MKKVSNLYYKLYLLKLLLRKSSILILINHLLVTIAFAQQVTTRLYTTNDGLPTSSVFGAYEDSFGYLWIGTSNGISRFDGKQFVNFNLADGLPSLFAVVTLEDSHHRLWAATRRGVACLLGNKFVVYPLNDSLDIDYVNGIIETKDKQVWCLTPKGVYQFEINTWKKIKLFPGYDNESCRQIKETDLGLFVNYGHLLAFRNRRNEWKILGEHQSSGPYFNVLYKYGQTVLVSTRNAIYKIENNRLIPLVEGLKGIGYFSLFVDSRDRLWYHFTNGDGAFHISSPGDFKKFTLQIPNRYGQVFIISEDTHGNFWAGTQEGLLKIQEVAFSSIEETDSTKIGAATNGIALKDSGLLLSSKYGLLFYHPDKPLGETVLVNPLKTIIDASTTDEEGRKWFITRHGELYRLDGNKLTDFSFLGRSLHAGPLLSCYYDIKKRRLFIACDSALLVGDDKKMEKFIPSNREKRVLLYEDVFATRNGFVLLKAVTGKIYTIDKNDSLFEWKETNLNHGDLGIFHESPNSDIWIVDVGNGLMQYRLNTNGKPELIKIISEKNGLQNNNIQSIAFDSSNRVWVASVTGLDILQKNNNQEWEVFNYSQDAGLQLNWKQTKLITDARGDVWATSWHTLVRFDTRQIKLKKEIPKVIIEKVQLNSKDVDWRRYTDSLSSYQQFPVNPKLNYEKNTISIFFNGISFSSFPRLEYSYQLNPVDSSWSLPTSNASVSFVNLPPGRYVFKVRTRDQASAWSLPAEFSFDIIAPFWMRWWFIALCVMVIASIIYSIYKYRINQLRKVLAMRTKISQDLHDEIGGSISGINLLSQMATEKLQNNKPDEASEYLFKVKTYTQDVIEKLSDMVWIFNPQNDSIERLLQRLKSFAIPVAASKNIQIYFSTDKENEMKNLNIRQRKAIYLISKEAINNTFKYAACNNIYYNLYTKGSKWRLTIQDDGHGFIANENEGGNGLKNMRARADEIGASFNIQSQTGGGTIVKVEF